MDAADPPLTDSDPQETREWLDALQAVVASAGPASTRAPFSRAA